MNALAISLQTYFTTFAHTQRDLSVSAGSVRGSNPLSSTKFEQVRRFAPH